MSTPNLEELIGGGRRPRDLNGHLPPDVADARRAEKQRRSNLAQGMAVTALRRLHHEDYRSLCEQALDKVNADRGPLPGDEAVA